jgi:hypothetical protein
MSDPAGTMGDVDATAVVDTSRGRAARAAQQALGGLPRPFWVLWTEPLVNRLGFFVEPSLVLYLSSARHLALAEVGAVLASYGGQRPGDRRGPAWRRRSCAGGTTGCSAWPSRSAT